MRVDRRTVQRATLHEEPVQHHTSLRRECVFEDRRQFLLVMVYGGEDQFSQPKVGRHFDFLSDQQIDTAPEDQARFELRAHHPGDLLPEEGPRRLVKGAEARAL